jgi:plasmid stabilization system protein ParE
VAHIELSFRAIERLDRMIVTHSLPADTRARVQRSLRKLEQFPLIGRQLDERWGDLRFIVGPWRWLLIVYVYEGAADRVLIVTIQDARSSASVTNLIAPR